ncbi:MAG TPA: hypothetical protein VNI77_05230 [Nitrososphaera sp.]|nr:hypothetical protein [Nitrososphaera sp.]
MTKDANAGFIKERLLPAFRDSAREAGRDPESLVRVLFFPPSYDPDKQKAPK